jgi:KaiC/GvpD/RAD55 family RecA-like ATPase
MKMKRPKKQIKSSKRVIRAKRESGITREGIGIKGIDSMIQGGLPCESITGVAGPPGVGKSIFSLHFILEGARKGQKCVYINLEEPRKNIDNMIRDFDFAEEFFKLEKKGLIIIKCFDYPEYEKLHLEILKRINEDNQIERLAIDSFNCFFHSLESSQQDKVNVRKIISESFAQFRRPGLTTLLILEKGTNDNHSGTSFDYNIPYLVDGIIKLDFLDLGTIERRIFVPKMRWTNQFKESLGYDIRKDGIIVEAGGR